MIDLYCDPAHAKLKSLVARFPGVEPMLKSAEFEDTREEIPPSAFADLHESRFPTHTPEHAVVSFLYANDQAVSRPVMDKIAEALYAYQVDPALFVPAPQEKVASSGASLFDDGSYPVGTPSQVKMAEERLFEEVYKVPLEVRVDLFNKLAHAAEKVGVALSPRGQAWGMAAHCDSRQLLEAVEARAALCKTAEVKTAYREIANGVYDDPTALRQYAVRAKLAQTLFDLDAKAGLDAAYERTIPDPLCSVFNRPAKLGEQLIHLGRNTYDFTRLLGLPATFYGDALGPEIVSEIAPGGVLDPEKLQAILPTLPADMMGNLEQGLQSAGVTPTGL